MAIFLSTVWRQQCHKVLAAVSPLHWLYRREVDKFSFSIFYTTSATVHSISHTTNEVENSPLFYGTGRIAEQVFLFLDDATSLYYSAGFKRSAMRALIYDPRSYK